MAFYLITGGCGFIGSHLAHGLIDQGHSILIIDDLSTGKIENAPPQAEVIVGDITTPGILERGFRDVDGCFHLAAISSVQACTERWLDSHKVNLDGTIIAFDAARNRTGGPVPVVYASSAAVYGQNGNIPLEESAPPAPLSPYGIDKAACEMHARIAGAHFGVPTTGLRFFNVFGPRQDAHSPYSGVISIFLERLRRNLPVSIHGDGGQVRDFIYVGDVVRFLIAAMETSGPNPRVANVCRGTGTTILELAEMLCELLGRPSQFQFGPVRAMDIQTSIGSPSLARSLLNIKAEVSLRDGLARTLATL